MESKADPQAAKKGGGGLGEAKVREVQCHHIERPTSEATDPRIQPSRRFTSKRSPCYAAKSRSDGAFNEEVHEEETTRTGRAGRLTRTGRTGVRRRPAGGIVLGGRAGTFFSGGKRVHRRPAGGNMLGAPAGTLTRGGKPGVSQHPAGCDAHVGVQACEGDLSIGSPSTRHASALSITC